MAITNEENEMIGLGYAFAFMLGVAAGIFIMGVVAFMIENPPHDDGNWQ